MTVVVSHPLTHVYIHIKQKTGFKINPHDSPDDDENLGPSIIIYVNSVQKIKNDLQSICVSGHKDYVVKFAINETYTLHINCILVYRMSLILKTTNYTYSDPFDIFNILYMFMLFIWSLRASHVYAEKFPLNQQHTVFFFSLYQFWFSIVNDMRAASKNTLTIQTMSKFSIHNIKMLPI